MQNTFCETKEEQLTNDDFPGVKLYSEESGYFQGVDEKQLLRITDEEDITISILEESSTFLVKGSLLLLVQGKEKVDDELKKRIFTAIDFYKGQPIERHAEYGFRQLAEVAIRALSPGINDPATAVLSINALTDLFARRIHHHPASLVKNEAGKIRIRKKVSSFEELFHYCIDSIWHYGKEDMYVQHAIIHMLHQLKKADNKGEHTAVFNKLMMIVNAQMQQPR